MLLYSHESVMVMDNGQSNLETTGQELRHHPAATKSGLLPARNHIMQYPMQGGWRIGVNHSSIFNVTSPISLQWRKGPGSVPPRGIT